MPGTERRLYALLAAVAALGPTAMQILMPALPALQHEFGVQPGQAQLTFSVFVLSMGPALLVYGPLSDRFGRRPVLSAAIGIFCAGTLLCLLAPSLAWLVVGRTVQALGAAAGLVITRALLSDLYGPEGMTAALSWTTMAMVVPAMLAPTLGGLLVDHAGWRWIFIALLLWGVAVLCCTWRYLPDPRLPAAHRHSSWGTKFRLVMSTRRFHPYALQAVLTLAMFYGFMAGAPYLVVDLLGRPATQYGLLFLLPATGFIAGNFLSARLVGRLGMDRLIITGALLAAVFAALPVLFTASGWWLPAAFFLPMTMITLANGLASASTHAGAITAVPQASGTASSVISFMQQTAGAVIIQLVALLHNDTPWPMVLVIFACAVLSLAGTLMLGRPPAAERSTH